MKGTEATLASGLHGAVAIFGVFGTPYLHRLY